MAIKKVAKKQAQNGWMENLSPITRNEQKSFGMCYLACNASKNLIACGVPRVMETLSCNAQEVNF